VTESAVGEREQEQTLVVFHLSDRTAALPVEHVEQIVPMAQLAHPPGLPSVVEGMLNLGGAAIPVFRLDRLFELPDLRVKLYSTLIILRDPEAGRFAILVDRVSHVAHAAYPAMLPLRETETWNGCAVGTLTLNGEATTVLSPARILLEREKQVLREFQALSQRRLESWEGSNA
jgi:purine-binding chemotaxis protein CheW